MKKRIKKLRLHRETLRNLNSMVLGEIAGGETEVVCGQDSGVRGDCLSFEDCDPPSGAAFCASEGPGCESGGVTCHSGQVSVCACF